MRLVKAAEMRSLDQEAWRRYGIPGIVLMENAGLSVVHYLLERFWSARPSGRKVLILAGPGNNGGDGLVVGRHLYNRGAGVEILLTAAPDSYQGDAAVNLKIVTAAGIPHWVFDDDWLLPPGGRPRPGRTGCRRPVWHRVPGSAPKSPWQR